MLKVRKMLVNASISGFYQTISVNAGICRHQLVKVRNERWVCPNLLSAGLGAPNILHSDTGGEFCNQIIKSLCEMWSDIKIVQGKPRHSESQCSVQRANQDVENMLATWMETNNTTKWSEGLTICTSNEKQSISWGNQMFTLRSYVWCSYETGNC